MVGMTACSWPAFSGRFDFCGGDVDCGQQILWTPVVHPPHQEDMLSPLFLQGNFDCCQHWADCCLYHCQDSHDHHFHGLHLFNWFLHGHADVHLHLFHSLVLGEVHLHCRFP